MSRLSRTACNCLAFSAVVWALPAGAAPYLPDFSAASFIPGAAIDNPYLPYAPGARFVQVARGVDEDGEPFVERDVQTVLGHGPEILGVRATTVQDKGFENGVLVEKTRDHFAQDTAGNVWYLGEDVVNYEYDDEGNLTGTNDEGAWRAGVDNALPGWAMPAVQILGQNYYQEFAPDNDALDEATTYAFLKQLTVGSTTYADVLQILETTAAEPDSREFKYYAPGFGLVRAEEGLDENLAHPEAVFDRVDIAAVPLPPTLLLLGAGLAALAGLRRPRRQRTTTLAPI